MARKGGDKHPKTSVSQAASCCKVEAILSVDERGQMVLPKEIREKVGIKAGDKLAIVSMEGDSGMCCITLIKAEELTNLVKSILGPAMKDLLG
ncbi:MAG: AbrB/MazE/SpoVT family DNA-binding domain-containing protein [Firmicutes bacterium]|nr:AbrB/MazE/SpoVT family DNA-binding domain-containing protein [Bacillota bacterium]